MISRNERRIKPRRLQKYRRIPSDSTIALFGILFTAAYKKIYPGLEELQKDLDEWLDYDNNRTHQGKRCQGRTPMDTFIAALELARQKNLDKEFNGVSDACQL
jgi:hypothetical protein